MLQSRGAVLSVREHATSAHRVRAAYRFPARRDYSVRGEMWESARLKLEIIRMKPIARKHFREHGVSSVRSISPVRNTRQTERRRDEPDFARYRSSRRIASSFVFSRLRGRPLLSCDVGSVKILAKHVEMKRYIYKNESTLGKILRTLFLRSDHQ